MEERRERKNDGETGERKMNNLEVKKRKVK